VEAATSLTQTTRDRPAPNRRRDQGHGRKLTEAFRALEAFPALAASRDRLLKVVRSEAASPGDMVAAVESDVALSIAVLRIANATPGPLRGRVTSVSKAVELIAPHGLEALATRTAVFDFFERAPGWDASPERFRLHALATQRAADRLAREVGYEDRDELLVSALLHDVGKLVLALAYPSYPRELLADARTPEERVHAERRELGVDHGLVGGVLARRWGLPGRLATVIERHHADDARGEAAIVRLADMLAHYGAGEPVSSNQLLRVGATLGLDNAGLRSVLYDLPATGTADRRSVDPCPLSGREIEVLRRLANGLVYKQIATDLGLSTSTVRTHLHNTYGKLGAVDRAQAVLIATERGWL
jgi:putative nucleotidyltransferase with HDIG domain